MLQKSDGAFLGFCGFKALTEDLGHQISPGHTLDRLRMADTDSHPGAKDMAWKRRGQFTLSVNDKLGLTNIEARAHKDNLGSLQDH